MEFTLLDSMAEKPINGLSKGMKQRLCLGRTMIHNPSVLVLDEPAAGLDPRARIELREMISQLAATGKAILISSHILTELAEMCDKVGIIEQGRLLAVGSVAEISARAQVQSTVRVRVLHDVERLKEWLAARDDVAELRLDGDLAIFSLTGDREAEAELLRTLVHAGFPVVEFGAKHKSLEDVFLHVTEGRVQ
jgi:ABC-2 type transport system ATP-binding protein